MEIIQDEIINQTVERLDTWNEPRSPEVLGNFVTSRLAKVSIEMTDDDLFGLVA